MKFHFTRSLVTVAAVFFGAEAWAATTSQNTQPPADPALRGKTDLAATTLAPEALAIKKTEISNFDFWHLQCDQYSDPKINKHCVARMSVFKPNGQQLLAVLVITQDETAKDWLLKVVIPTSISVQDGATIEFESSAAKPQNFPIETCEPQACASNLPLDAALIQQLKSSNKVTLSWTTIDHSPIKFDFEIKGIQQTMKALFG